MGRRPDRPPVGRGRAPGLRRAQDAARTQGGGQAGRSQPSRRQDAPRTGSRQQQAARGLGGEQVEGRHAVAELLAARRRRAIDVWISQDLPPAPIIDRIEVLAADQRVPVRRVGRVRLEAEAATDAPQGVLAHAHPLPEAELDALCRPARAEATSTAEGRPGRPPRSEGRSGPPPRSEGRPGPPFLLALDGVTDPRNLGALLRSAEAAGATGALLPRHRAAHITPAVAKAAAGAIERVPMALVAGMPAALSRAKELGCWVVGLAADGEQSLFDLPVADQPVVLVVGSEGAGLARLTRGRCDLVVSIPMRGTMPSLNVSAAGALALFEVSRRRRP